MSKRNAIILIIAVVILVIGGLLFLYFKNANAPVSSATASGTAVSLFGETSANKPASTSTGNATIGGLFGGGSSANATGAAIGQVYKNPVSAAAFFASGTADVLEFIDRGTGNVYEYLPGGTAGPARVTNTTIPKVQEAVFTKNGAGAIFRYLDAANPNAIDSLAGRIVAATTSGEIGSVTGSLLPQNILEAASSPAGDKLFSITADPNGGSYGSVSLPDGTGGKRIMSSPISSWNAAWPAANIIALTTKPSAGTYGYLFFMNPQTGAMTRILGDLPGLSAVVNGDASLVAYSESVNGTSASLGIYDIGKNAPLNVSLPTLADKCAWSPATTTLLYCAVPQTIPADSYPDAWYQGTESFTDAVWSLNAQTGQTTEIYQPASGASFDAEDLSVSPSGTYLSFINKDDLSLWVLKIK